MTQITPEVFLKDFTKKYAPSSYEGIAKLIDANANHNEIEKSVKKMLSSEEFTTNFTDQNKLIIGYAKRKSKSDKVLYSDFIYKPNKKKLVVIVDNVIVASGTKNPYDHDITKIPKYQQIIFRKMDRSEIEGGDYIPKVDADPVKQQHMENTMNEMITLMERNTALLTLVLDLLCKELHKVAKIMLEKFKSEDKKSLEYKLYKVATGKSACAINLFQQHTANDPDSNEEVKLINPINRVRISIDQKTGKLGFDTGNGFVYPILDGRKMASKKVIDSVQAQVLVKGVKSDIDYKTSPAFITRKSRMHIELNFEGSLSKFGLSIVPKIKKAIVYTHLSREKESHFKQDKICQFMDQDEKEIVIEADSIQDSKTTSKSKKHSDDEEDDSNDEDPEDDDGANNRGGSNDTKDEDDKPVESEQDDNIDALMGDNAPSKEENTASTSAPADKDEKKSKGRKSSKSK